GCQASRQITSRLAASPAARAGGGAAGGAPSGKGGGCAWGTASCCAPTRYSARCPAIFFRLSIPRLTWSTVPASAYLTLRIRSTVHSEGGSAVYGFSGYFSASSGVRKASQKPKPPKEFWE